MLDVTAEALANHLLTILPAGQLHPRADLSTLPLPVAHYLGSVLDRRSDQKAAAPESPWLDSDHELIQTARKVWKTAAREAAQFPEGAWTKAVRTASRQVLSFLVEPVEALVSFTFADATTVLQLDALQERMASFSPYPYFREVAEGYVERKGLDGVEKEEFEKLLNRIDTRMVAKFETADWMMLLEPLFALVKSIPDYEEGVPAGLLRKFFEAKGMSTVASKLIGVETYSEDQLRDVLNASAQPALPKLTSKQAEEPEAKEKADDLLAVVADESKAGSSSEPLWQRLARDKAAASAAVAAGNQDDAFANTDDPDDAIEVDDVDAAIRSDDVENALNEAEEIDEEIKEEVDAQEDAEEFPEEGPEVASETEADEGVEDDVQKEDDVEDVADDVEDEENTSDETGEVDIVDADFEDVEVSEDDDRVQAEPLWMKLSSKGAAAVSGSGNSPPASEQRGTSDDSRHEPLVSLETRVLGASATERRDWYAQQLTRGSELAYRDILEALDEAESWNDAWPILKDSYQANKVEIYSDAIVAFTDAVEGRYRS